MGSKSAGSLLRSEDSNSALDAMYRHGGHATCKGRQHEHEDWEEVKQRRKERYMKAHLSSRELKQRSIRKKSQSALKMAEQVKSEQYCGRLPLRKFEHETTAVVKPSSQMTSYELHDVQLELTERIFYHWCKKGAQYLKIDAFVQNMVIYGLVPNEEVLMYLIEDIEARFQKPQFMNTEDMATA